MVSENDEGLDIINDPIDVPPTACISNTKAKNTFKLLLLERLFSLLSQTVEIFK